MLFESAAWKGELFVEVFREAEPERVRALHHEFGGTNRRRKIALMGERLFGRALPPPEVGARLANYQRGIAEHLLRSPWVAGAREAVEGWAARVPLAVASGADAIEVRQLLEHHGLTGCFAEICGHPEPKSRAARRHRGRCGASPRRPGAVWFVGDAPEDRQAALQAGCTFLLRETPGNRELFEDHVGPRLSDLEPLAARARA